MQLEQGFTVAVAPDVVWAAFHDPGMLVSCLPGASLRGPVEDGRLPLLFKVKLGPIAAAFSGDGTVTLDEAARSGVFAGHATDGKSNSRVKGEAGFSVEPDGEGTRVRVAVTFTITGSLAQFSREGIVRALADQLTRQFAANLQTALADGVEPPADFAQAAQQQAAAPGQPSLFETSAASPPEPAAPAARIFRPDDVASASGPACSSQPQPPRSAAAPAKRRASRREESAPALDLLTLVGAVLKGYWHRLTGKGTR